MLRTYGIHGRNRIGRDRNAVFEIFQKYAVPTCRARIFLMPSLSEMNICFTLLRKQV